MTSNDTQGQTASDIAQQVQSLRSYFSSGATRSLDWRKQQLLALKACLENEKESIGSALGKDLGKGEYENWSTEIGFVIGEIDYALKNLKKWSKKRKTSTPIVAQPGESFLQAEPLGTVLIIGAWNYPVQLVLSPLVAALSAGNCAVVKPSELSENCSKALAVLLPKYLSAEAVTVIEGGVAETTELLAQRFDHILYTGGERVAKIVMRAAAEYLTPVTLELGGKSPCIVDSNADLKVAASRIAWSKWMNVGQTCVAPDYLIVERANLDAMVQALTNKLKEFYGTNPAQNPDYGRIINQRNVQRLASYLEGQNVALGGEYDIEQRYFAPTIVVQPDLNSALMQEEVFGPILPIVCVDKIEQAIEMVNSRAKPLAMYIYTKDKALEQNILSSTSAGSVAVNDGFMFMTNPRLPFGGVGNSGMGRYHGEFGFDTFSHLKAVIRRPTFIDPSLRYPPYTNFKVSVMKKLV